MINIILPIILGVIGFYFSKQIRKSFTLLLGLSILIGIFVYFQPDGVGTIIYEGFLGLAFYLAVMFAGAFKKDSKLSKRLRALEKNTQLLVLSY